MMGEYTHMKIPSRKNSIIWIAICLLMIWSSAFGQRNFYSNSSVFDFTLDGICNDNSLNGWIDQQTISDHNNIERFNYCIAGELDERQVNGAGTGADYTCTGLNGWVDDTCNVSFDTVRQNRALFTSRWGFIGWTTDPVIQCGTAHGKVYVSTQQTLAAPDKLAGDFIGNDTLCDFYQTYSFNIPPTTFQTNGILPTDPLERERTCGYFSSCSAQIGTFGECGSYQPGVAVTKPANTESFCDNDVDTLSYITTFLSWSEIMTGTVSYANRWVSYDGNRKRQCAWIWYDATDYPELWVTCNTEAIGDGQCSSTADWWLFSWVNDISQPLCVQWVASSITTTNTWGDKGVGEYQRSCVGYNGGSTDTCTASVDWAEWICNQTMLDNEPYNQEVDLSQHWSLCALGTASTVSIWSDPYGWSGNQGTLERTCDTGAGEETVCIVDTIYTQCNQTTTTNTVNSQPLTSNLCTYWVPSSVTETTNGWSLGFGQYQWTCDATENSYDYSTSCTVDKNTAHALSCGNPFPYRTTTTLPIEFRTTDYDEILCPGEASALIMLDNNNTDLYNNIAVWTTNITYSRTCSDNTNQVQCEYDTQCVSWCFNTLRDNECGPANTQSYYDIAVDNNDPVWLQLDELCENNVVPYDFSFNTTQYRRERTCSTNGWQCTANRSHNGQCADISYGSITTALPQWINYYSQLLCNQPNSSLGWLVGDISQRFDGTYQWTCGWHNDGISSSCEVIVPENGQCNTSLTTQSFASSKEITDAWQCTQGIGSSISYDGSTNRRTRLCQGTDMSSSDETCFAWVEFPACQTPTNGGYFSSEEEIITAGQCAAGSPSALIRDFATTPRTWTRSCETTIPWVNDEQCTAQITLPDFTPLFDKPEPTTPGEYVDPPVTVKLNGYKAWYLTIHNNNGSDEYEFIENGSFTFQFTDRAGNQWIYTVYVDRINEILPFAEIVYSPAWPTPDSVTVSLDNLNDETTVISYNGDWLIKGAGATTQIEFTDNGQWTFTLTNENGTRQFGINVVDIDRASPTANILYSTVYPTSDTVTASIINQNEQITITNNGWSTDYIFTENSSFTFEYIDRAGNTGATTATVNWIDTNAPTAQIFYSTTELTSWNVIATIGWFNKSWITILNNSGNATYNFTNNGSFTFLYEDTLGNQWSITAEVNRIDKRILQSLIEEYESTICQKLRKKLPEDIQWNEVALHIVTAIRNCLMKWYELKNARTYFFPGSNISRGEFIRVLGRFLHLTVDYESYVYRELSENYIGVISDGEFEEEISEADALGLLIYTPLISTGTYKTIDVEWDMTQREALYMIKQVLHILWEDKTLVDHIFGDGTTLTRWDTAYIFSTILRNYENIVVGNNLEFMKALRTRIGSFNGLEKKRFITRLLRSIREIPTFTFYRVWLHPEWLREDLTAIAQWVVPIRKSRKFIQLKTLMDEFLRWFADPTIDTNNIGDRYNYRVFDE